MRHETSALTPRTQSFAARRGELRASGLPFVVRPPRKMRGAERRQAHPTMPCLAAWPRAADKFTQSAQTKRTDALASRRSTCGDRPHLPRDENRHRAALRGAFAPPSARSSRAGRSTQPGGAPTPPGCRACEARRAGATPDRSLAASIIDGGWRAETEAPRPHLRPQPERTPGSPGIHHRLAPALRRSAPPQDAS